MRNTTIAACELTQKKHRHFADQKLMFLPTADFQMLGDSTYGMVSDLEAYENVGIQPRDP